MDLCDDLANAIRAKIVANTAITSLAAQFLRLYEADPTTDPDVSADEVAGGSYTGKAITWATNGTGAGTSLATVTFANMPATTVTYGAVGLAAAGATFWLFKGPLTVPKTVAAGDSLEVAAGDFDWDFS